MMQARGRVMEMLEKIIKERRNEINSHNHNHHHEDFLQQLLAADNDSFSSSSDHSTKLTDAEIKDNILTMIIAGPIYFIEYQSFLDLLIERKQIKILNQFASFLF